MVSNEQPPQVVVVMLPFPTLGHLNQLLHLSVRIASHNIPVHYVGASSSNQQAINRVRGSDPNPFSNIHFHLFKESPIQNETNNHSLPRCFNSSIYLREPVTKLVQSLSCAAKKVVVIHDSLLASVAQDVKKIRNVENYTFHSASVFTVSSFQWCLPGKPLPKGPFFSPLPSVGDCFLPGLKDFLGAQGEFIKLSDGNIYNSSRAIERPYLNFLDNITGVEKKHWALGPFHFQPLSSSIIEKNDSKGGTGKRHSCMEWLDKQKVNSVIYVSFGTTCIFTEEQIEQIAIGLEQSKQRFIWLLRGAGLPNGYEERIEGVGLVVRNWTPQLKILSHPSTGGFMSHCGWSSCIESLSTGVPIATWPVHSGQPRNSILITEVLKVGLVVKDWSKRKELVTAAMIENVVRRLMETKEGDEMRERALKIKDDIRGSMAVKGGVSRLEMDCFISRIKSMW